MQSDAGCPGGALRQPRVKLSICG